MRLHSTLLIFLLTSIIIMTPQHAHAKRMNGLYFGIIDKGAGTVIAHGSDVAITQHLASMHNIRIADASIHGYSHDKLIKNRRRVNIYISQACRRVGAERGLYMTITRIQKQYTLTCHVISPHTYKEVHRYSVTYSPASMSERACKQILDDMDEYFVVVKRPQKIISKDGYYLRQVKTAHGLK